MNKKTIFIMAAAIVILGSVTILSRNSAKEQGGSFQISEHSEDLLASSREGYNFVTVYKQEDLLIIAAESDSGFFDGLQFTVETQGEVKPEDIEIIWTTIGGGTEKTENNDFIFAEIIIYENDKLIVDTKINFMAKAFDALEDVLERQVR